MHLQHNITLEQPVNLVAVNLKMFWYLIQITCNPSIAKSLRSVSTAFMSRERSKQVIKIIFSEWNEWENLNKIFVLVKEFHSNWKILEFPGYWSFIMIDKIFPALFGQIWSKKSKLVCLRWNLTSRLIRICWIQRRCSLFLFFSFSLDWV